MLQRLIPDHVRGRAFGVLDAIDSWGFAGAVLLGGALASSAGGRATFAVAAAGALAVLLAAARALRMPSLELSPVPA
jgi:predicted MFS family arabinose efflux permease